MRSLFRCSVILCALCVGQQRSRAQAVPDAVPAQSATGATAAPWSPTAVAIQGGLSGVTLTVEGEVRLPWGVVAGIGVHDGRFAPVGPTARLAYDHALGRSLRWHIRGGLRLYPFAESTDRWSCDRCTFLVGEVGLRYEAASGLVFEFGVPIVRSNLSRVNDEGFWQTVKVDGSNALLVSLLLGFSHRF